MEPIYIASRASLPERSAMWRRYRDAGVPIISSWIDEADEGATEDFGKLWERIVEEIRAAARLVLYVEPTDFPLKGAFVEVGAALLAGKPVTICMPGIVLSGASCRPIGSWIRHPLVEREDDIAKALRHW